MPSHTVKQAKTMSAIAHGWRPTGEAADIPVPVAKEFHAADKGKKYGKGQHKKGYDRSAHYKGNPGFPSSSQAGTSPALTRSTKMGGYEKDAHGGVGKGQKLLKPAVGMGNNRPTPHTEPIPHRGHGAEAHGYNKDAHTHKHHGKGGEAVGHVGDNEPMGYHGQLQGEGRVNKPFAHNQGHHTTKIGFADHHHHPVGEAHSFRGSGHDGTHGFGHSSSQREGPHRLSGHPNAHRIGRRGK
jgi:hypothetical protein